MLYFTMVNNEWLMVNMISIFDIFAKIWDRTSGMSSDMHISSTPTSRLVGSLRIGAMSYPQDLATAQPFLTQFDTYKYMIYILHNVQISRKCKLCTVFFRNHHCWTDEAALVLWMEDPSAISQSKWQTLFMIIKKDSTHRLKTISTYFHRLH